MAEALLGIVIQNLKSFVQDQLATFWGVDQLTQKLSRNLTAIRAVLGDAEKKQITSEVLKIWLQNLTDAAYVLDDILDECSIHSTKVHSDDGHTSCLSPLHPKNILFGFYIGKRIKDITQRFHDIHEQKSRDQDREQIVKFLLEDAGNSEDLSVYPIVGNVEVENVGNKVWNKLYRRSFFQEAKSDDFGMIRICKMHDLFHDLSQSIMGEECVIIEKGRLTQLPTRVHHLHLLNYDASVNMAAFKKVESMRTFLNFGNSLPSTHCLRVLRTHSSLLFPFKDLAHLRYLSLHSGSGARLNNLICELPKLQILKLQNTTQLRLPKELTQLQDLRHIVINSCGSMSEMPPNIGKLRNLRTLSTFVVGSKAGCGLAELHSLKLGGTLRIKGLENIPNEWDAKQANLIGKKDLNILDLSWGGSANSEGSNVNVERVLEALQPPSTLKSFGMNGYQGRQLPSWMRSPVVLRDLVEVKLFGCENYEELPPLGKLPHLKRLVVGGMKNVKWIDGESYDGVEEKAFPSLEELRVDNLPNLERMLREEGIEMLPRLSQLTIVGVSNLKFPRLPSIEELHASDMDEAASLMEGVLENMPCLKTFHITMIKGRAVLPDQLRGLGALQTLSIGYWYNLECATFDMSGEFEDQMLFRAGDSTKQYDSTNCPSDCHNRGLLHINLWLTMYPLPTNSLYSRLQIYFIAGLGGRHHFSSTINLFSLLGVEDFAEVFAVAYLDCMHVAMNKLNSNSKKINPQVESVCDFIVLCSWPSVEYQCMPTPGFVNGMDFAEVFVVAYLDCMHVAMNKLNSDSKKINPPAKSLDSILCVCISARIYLLGCIISFEKQSISIRNENLELKLENEEKALILFNALPNSYEHF
ncbi:hypothetical protein VNO80_09076 [Phaseolus coccineus]|uniref:Rx N-terminal domain-containing protein n=1 Tax=Phaseolus coccineus TaxID=3886 RepID=A0AAN9RHZ6_PHACN